MKVSLNIKGRLTILEKYKAFPYRKIFEENNLIVDQGKGAIMDYLGSLGYAETYTISPFTAIVLTSNAVAAGAANTFVNSVFDPVGSQYITNEGALHIPSWTNVSHSEGGTTLTLSGTIAQAYGNTAPNNVIRSATVCMGTNLTVGGPGEGAYSATGNERLFSRVAVGELVKTADKTYTFSWTFQITT
jgi:hypothetical protein